MGVANLHVETAIDQDSGKLTMLYQVGPRPSDLSTVTGRRIAEGPSALGIRVHTTVCTHGLCGEHNGDAKVAVRSR